MKKEEKNKKNKRQRTPFTISILPSERHSYLWENKYLTNAKDETSMGTNLVLKVGSALVSLRI